MSASNWATAPDEKYTYNKSATSTIRNVGGTQTGANVELAWQWWKRDGQLLILSFDYRFSNTFGSAASAVLIQLPTYNGAVLRVDTGNQPGGAATTFRGSPHYGYVGFMTSAAAYTDCHATYSLGVTTDATLDATHIRIVNSAGSSVLDDACVTNVRIRGYSLQIPILGWS